MLPAQFSASFQSLYLLSTSKLGPSDADSRVGGFVYILRPWGLSPTSSCMKPGVSPAVSTPTGVFSQTFEALFPQAGSLGCAVCLAPQLFLLVCPHANVGPPAPPPCPESSPPSCLSPPFLPDWVNVSLSPWFSSSMQFDFLAVLVVLVLKLFFLPFFWLCEEVKCFYLRLHLDWNSSESLKPFLKVQLLIS